MKQLTACSHDELKRLDEQEKQVAQEYLAGQEESVARDYMEHSHADATRRAYRSDWAIFERWCDERELASLPVSPEALVRFLASQAKGGPGKPGLAASTVTRRLAAIVLAHTNQGLGSPGEHAAVIRVMRGIRRKLGTEVHPKAAATGELIRMMVDPIDIATVRGARDRALLLLGFAGAFRRSEIGAMEVADLKQVEQGLLVRLPRSKTDQEGKSQTVPVLRSRTHYCPVAALEHWLKHAEIKDGVVFRRMYRGDKVSPYGLTGYSIAGVVKDWAGHAGLAVKDFSAHSLRSGFVTSSVENGKKLVKIIEVTRHKDIRSLTPYIERVNYFKDHSGEDLL